MPGGAANARGVVQGELRGDLHIAALAHPTGVVGEGLCGNLQMTRGIELRRAARLDLLGGLAEAVLVAAVDRIGRGGIAIVQVARSERGTPVDETVGDDR